MDKYDVALGIIIAKRRKERKLSQSQLGNFLGVGKTCICGWEKGRRGMSTSEFFKVCEYLFLEPNEVALKVREMVHNEEV